MRASLGLASYFEIRSGGRSTCRIDSCWHCLLDRYPSAVSWGCNLAVFTVPTRTTEKPAVPVNWTFQWFGKSLVAG